MEKDCGNCYWENYKNMHCIYKKDKPKENVCDKHSFFCCKCEDISVYKYKDEYWCQECLFKQFDVEEDTVTHYYADGELLGTDEDMEGVIRNIDSDIEEIN